MAEKNNIETQGFFQVFRGRLSAINGEATVKIKKGDKEPIPKQYGDNMRTLIDSLLTLEKSKRPKSKKKISK